MLEGKDRGTEATEKAAVGGALPKLQETLTVEAGAERAVLKGVPEGHVPILVGGYGSLPGQAPSHYVVFFSPRGDEFGAIRVAMGPADNIVEQRQGASWRAGNEIGLSTDEYALTIFYQEKEISIKGSAGPAVRIEDLLSQLEVE